ncbi:hypothetical protein Q8F55_004022 [Vanrija albida]|uniref:Wings apart-like protein C-terminal domain-containing protein n=1 Tax=Vanrija albida TaxID=181172 RepID=A0ABR3Q5K5_9TREE
MGTLSIKKLGATAQEPIVLSSDSDDLARPPNPSPAKPRIPPSSSQSERSPGDIARSRSGTASTRASESPLKQSRAQRKYGCDDRGWRPGQLTKRELASSSQVTGTAPRIKREPSQQSQKSPGVGPSKRRRPEVLVEETIISPKRKLPQQQGARKKGRVGESSSSITPSATQLEVARTPRQDVVQDSISYDASPTPTRPKPGPLQDRDPGQQLPPPQPNFGAANGGAPKRKPSGKKGRLSDLMAMDEESYRPPPPKTTRKSSKSSSKSASSSIARNRPPREAAKGQPGRYEIPQMSAPLDMWTRKPSASKGGLLSRPAEVTRAPKAPVAASRAPRALERQRSVSSELSPAPETQAPRPLQRVESSLLSPAPETPEAERISKKGPPPTTPSRTRPPVHFGSAPRASQGAPRPEAKSPSSTESPPTDVAPAFDDIDDVLAQYADFAVSPAQSMVSLASRRSQNATPRTPRHRQATGARLSLSPLASRTHLPTPARSGTDVPNSHSHTPAKPTLTSEIWKEHERDQSREDDSYEKAEMRAEARRERLRQTALQQEEMDEEAELDLDLQFSLPEAAEEQPEEPPEPPRRSTRGRRSNETRPASSPSEPDAEEQARLKSKKKNENAFKKLLNDRARDAARGRGAEAIDAALEALSSPSPSPDRGLLFRGSWGAAGEAAGIDVDEDAKEVAKEFMAARTAAASRQRELAMKVFWGESSPQCEASGSATLSTSNEADAVVKLLQEVQDPSGLMSYLAAGIVDAADEVSLPNISDWLFTLAFSADSNDLAWTAVHNLRQVMERSSTPFMTGERLLARVQSVWASLGAKPESSTSRLFDEAVIKRSRDDASAIICSVVESAARKNWLGTPELEAIVLRLFTLLADPSTTAVLSQQVAQTISTILPALQATVVDLAFKAADLVAALPASLQARVVLALGESTTEVRQLVRWLAISLVLPELRSDDGAAFDTDFLQQGLDRVEVLMAEGTDYWAASDAFTMWSLALGDFDSLAAGSTSSFADDLRRHLIHLLHTIRDKAEEGPAASLKGRMDQLRHVLKLQRDKIRNRRGQHTDAASLLLGQERGQTRLSFVTAQ